MTSLDRQLASDKAYIETHGWIVEKTEIEEVPACSQGMKGYKVRFWIQRNTTFEPPYIMGIYIQPDTDGETSGWFKAAYNPFASFERVY